MIVYLIKMTLCSAVLLLFYRMVLEREKLLFFNRFYLLGSLILSLVLPLVPLEILLQNPVFPAPPDAYAESKASGMHAYTVQLLPQMDGPENFTWFGLLGVVYLAVSLWMLMLFGKNLLMVIRRIRSHAIEKYEGMKLILLDVPAVPHSFLNNIFVSKTDFLNNALEQEIMGHERAHAQQLHSLDILFVEFLKVIFWLNPAINYYRNAIAMNHEFLADAAVTKDLPDISNYQHLLLQKSANPAHLPFISKFNYSFIKKRFIMMYKQTSPRRAALAQGSVLPILVFVFVAFSDLSLAQIAPPPPPVEMAQAADDKVYVAQAGISDEEMIEYKLLVNKYKADADTKKGIVKVPQPDRKRMGNLSRGMTSQQRSETNIWIIERSNPAPATAPSDAEFKKFKDPYTYGVWIDGKKVPNSELDNYEPSDFSNSYVSRLYGKAKNVKGKYKYKAQLDLMTNAYYKTYRDAEIAQNKEYMHYVEWVKPAKNN